MNKVNLTFYSIIFLIFIVFNSCRYNDQKVNNFNLFVQNTINEDIESLKESLEMHYGYIHKNYDQNRAKVENLFTAGKELRRICEEKIKFIELNENDNISLNVINDTINSLNIQIDKIISAFLRFKENIRIDSLLNFNLQLYGDLSRDEIALIKRIYINRILLAENKIVRIFAESISVDCFRNNTFKIHVFNECSKIKTGECFTTRIAPPLIDMYNTMRFSVDTFYRNGRKIQINIEKGWFDGLGLIKICPKECGSYSFTGKVFSFDYLGKELSYPFQGEFTVEEK